MSEQAFQLIEGSLSRRMQPAVMTLEQKAPTQEEIDNLFKERITPETDLPPMQPLFRMFGVPCFYRGELVADCGRAKSGKTFFLSILMACAQKNQVLALEDGKCGRAYDQTRHLHHRRHQGPDDRHQRRGTGYSYHGEDDGAGQGDELLYRLRAPSEQERAGLEHARLHRYRTHQQGLRGVPVYLHPHTYSRKPKMKRKFYYCVNTQGLPEELSDYREQPRDFQGRWTKEENTTKVDPDINMLQLFTAAMEGRGQRKFSEVMAVAIKKCGVPDSATYYAHFALAKEQGIIRDVVNPATGDTWVELLDNSLPF